MPLRCHAFSSLSLSSGRSVREKGSSPVPCGQRGGLSHAVRDDLIPKDPKTSLYFGSSLSLSSSLLRSSNGVRDLFSCSFSIAFVAAAIASANGIMFLDSDSPSAQDSGQVGSPLCSRRMKLILGSG